LKNYNLDWWLLKMSEDYLAQAQPTQTWNTARGVWEKQGIANLLCEHWELFSETWQTSGTMRNGKVYELPTQGPHTTDSECSSLPTQVFGTVTTATSGRSPKFRKGSNPNPVEFAEDLARHLLRSPTASQGEGGALGEAEARKRGNTVGVRDNAMDIARLNGLKVSRAVDNLMPTPKARDSQAEGYEAGLRRATPQVGTIVKGLVDGDPRVLMPTPNTMDHLPARTPEQKALNKHKGGYANVRETVVNDLLPTPVASEGTKASAAQSSSRRAETGQVFLTNIIHDVAVENGHSVPLGNLLPTTTASDWKGPNHSGSGSASSRGIATAVEQTSWGKFEPAIRRWEQTLGRPAPLPTNPDGKDGAHRLSSKFTEWMMGLPEGWVTGVGLSRNEELKACGNGVVPQQAELALRILLEGVTLPTGGGQVNLPTPTVSDTYTDNLQSTQQKEGSMHSVTLPQAVRMVAATRVR